MSASVVGAVDKGEEFRTRGFVHVPRLLPEPVVEEMTRHLETLSGRSRRDLLKARFRLLPNRGVVGAWTLPDGVTKRPEFWPLITNPTLLGVVREILGGGVSYLQHSDLHVSFSAVTWHRDSVNRAYLEGGDWDEAKEPYRLMRVGFYLQSFEESGFSLGLIPGTHRPEAPDTDSGRATMERQTRWPWNAASLLSGTSPLDRVASWVKVEKGDAILFDPRILHAGSRTKGPKYSIFLAYGVAGEHFRRHARYYRHQRPELAYGDVPSDLVRRLAEARLDAPPHGSSEGDGDGAWRPPFWQVSLGRRVRAR